MSEEIIQPALAPASSLAGRFAHLRVAIVHHWFVRRGGAERVVEELAQIFPQADLFTLLLDRRTLGPALAGRRIATSFVQHFPGARRHHRFFLPLFPLALEQFDLRGYDVVISSESGPSKGVITGASTCHICYCHTPMRYLWDMYHGYRQEMPLGILGRAAFAWGAHRVRLWDRLAADRVDAFVASSHNAARRIRKHYRREATIIYPPVNTEAFATAAQPEDFYLVVSRLVAYKRVDLAIRACNRLKRRLVVIGGGEAAASLRALAGPAVEFLGEAHDEEVKRRFAACRALLFPGEEDIGLAPIEAQASGRPVIAFGRGGALETVCGFYPGQSRPTSATGVFFAEPSEESLCAAILTYEQNESAFVPSAIRQHAARFGQAAFREKVETFVGNTVAQFQSQENYSLDGT